MYIKIIFSPGALNSTGKVNKQLVIIKFDRFEFFEFLSNITAI